MSTEAAVAAGVLEVFLAASLTSTRKEVDWVSTTRRRTFRIINILKKGEINYDAQIGSKKVDVYCLISKFHLSNAIQRNVILTLEEELVILLQLNC